MKNIVKKVTAAWRKVPRAIRSGWITAWVAFLSTIVAIGTNLLPALVDLITTHDYAKFAEHLSTSATLSVSAVNAFLAGVVNAIYRWLRPIEQSYRTPPSD